MDQGALIAGKHEIRSKIARAQATLSALQTQYPNSDNVPWQVRRRMNKLSDHIEQLMAQEYSIRIAIDQTR